jgi:uncharacterized FAD-dependent dehydrogenase
MAWEEVAWRLRKPPPRSTDTARPIVVGAGPAGLFAALRLCAYGLAPVIFERGGEVDERVRDVSRYWRSGELDRESNVQFGEGGAGTFSDGKLTYRGKDFRRGWVLERLVEAGAPAEILFEAHAHVGTDRLRDVLRRLRRTLTDAGASFRFRARVDGLVFRSGRVVGVEHAEGSLAAPAVFLAPGHSARDLLRTLFAQGVPVEAKGFAVGVRVEVPQGQVNGCQYGRWADCADLPPAEFTVKARAPSGRDVYSFCMCPGGVVIPAGTDPEGLVVNGMSASARSGRWANAALVVPCSPGDIGGGALAGVALQEEIERAAFCLAGSRAVPAEGVADFLSARRSRRLPSSSCPWPLVPAELSRCLPVFAREALRGALPELVKKLPPLGTGTLLAAETRTSSPIRIPRDERMECVGLPGLYPVGEGAGHAGGIVSAAVDGARAVDAYAERLGGGVVPSRGAWSET